MKRPEKALVFLVDGFDPAYVQPARMPRLAALGRAGASTLDGRGVLPSLTNVNHISLLTGTYPERHGLSTNFYFDRATWSEVFMDQVSFVREPLLFERLEAAGWSTALVTAKEKLTRLLRRGLDHCVDMKSHPEAFRAAVGVPPDIFSLEINLWVLRMAREVATRLGPDFLYVATTDYPQHKFGPDEPAMQAYLEESDDAIGRLLDVYDLDETVVMFTADHGMNAKPRSLSPVRVLAEAGIRTHGVPLIRDGLFAHHRDLGGALYLYFQDPAAVPDARAVLARTPGIDGNFASNTGPMAGKKPLAASSAYTRHSMAWPCCRMSSCRQGRRAPPAMRICACTRSMPVTISVTGCSTWMRVFISRKWNCLSAPTMNSTVPAPT